MGKTLFDKLWERHVVLEEGEGTAVIYRSASDP